MQIVKLKDNQLTPEQVEKTIQTLENNQLIIYPTETCYGIGADASSEKAVTKLLDYKGSRRGEPISVAVSGKKMAQAYVKINTTAENLYQNFLPGPLTIVSQSLHKVDPRLESEQGTLGIRIPDYQAVLKLIKEFDRPITSTSANISGGKTPYTIEDILSQLSDKKKSMIGLIIDAGELDYHTPSAVVDTTLNEPAILRQGEIDFSQLNTQTVFTDSEDETQALGKQLIENNFKIIKEKPVIFALQGELGAGKTQIAKGIGQGLKIDEIIKSPTYILIREYPYSVDNTSGIFYHIDAWRMESPEELTELDIKDKLKPENVIAIEWIQKGKEILQEIETSLDVKIIYIDLEYLSKTERKIRFTD